jgi:hypothetical protein
MKTSKYYKSEAHQNSVKNASKIAVNTKYCCVSCKNIYPTFNFKRHFCQPCSVCKSIFTGTQKQFCSKSCAVTSNNKKRTPAMRKKQSDSIKITQSLNPELKNNFKNYIQPEKTFSRIQITQCNYCVKYMITRNWQTDINKFCSQECRTNSRMKKQTNHHGHKKIYKYFNVYTNEFISLESSWEFKIAQFLDQLNIIWIRPDPIAWVDKNLKSHLYYADFYLPNYNLYLDPKNPYVMQNDAYKMSVIEQRVNIFYGAINYIKENIKNIIFKSGQGAGS